MKEQARNEYRALSNEEQDIKRIYRRHRYRNISEGDKQNLREYQKAIVTLKNIFSYVIYNIRYGQHNFRF